MEKIHIAPFSVNITNKSISVHRNKSKLSLLTGECEPAINVVVHALSLAKVKVLPEKINHSPFEIRFTPERVLFLARKDSQDNIAFKFEEGNALIEAIKQGKQKLRDIGTIQPAPGGGPSHFQRGDPVIPGR